MPVEFIQAESWPTGHEAHAAYSSEGKIYVREGTDPSTAVEIVPHEELGAWRSESPWGREPHENRR